MIFHPLALVKVTKEIRECDCVSFTFTANSHNIAIVVDLVTLKVPYTVQQTYLSSITVNIISKDRVIVADVGIGNSRNGQSSYRSDDALFMKIESNNESLQRYQNHYIQDFCR